MKSFLLFILLFLQCKWIPRLEFHRTSFKPLYDYGIKIFSATCLTKIVDEGGLFIIGKFLTPHSLGIYTRSNQFAQLPSSSIGTTVSTVLFPSLALYKEDKERFNTIYQQAIKYQAMITIPLFCWLAMISSPMIRLLLTDKWESVIPLLQIMCIGRILSPIANITEQAYNAIGRSDLFLKQQIYKMLLKILLYSFFIQFGLLWIVIAEAIFSITQYFITNKIGGALLAYSIKSQLYTIKTYLFSALISSSIGYTLLSITPCPITQIGLSLSVAFCLYVTILITYGKKEDLLFLIYQIKRIIK